LTSLDQSIVEFSTAVAEITDEISEYPRPACWTVRCPASRQADVRNFGNAPEQAVPFGSRTASNGLLGCRWMKILGNLTGVHELVNAERGDP
jgi:hypothetical protein